MAPAFESKFALIVDENTRSSEVLFELLEGQGFWPVCAAHEDEALEYLHQELPAIVALDLAMPRSAGRRVLEALRTNPLWVHVPVVVLVGPTDVLEEGAATARFTKPLEIETFLRAVKHMLRGDASRPRQVH